MKLEMDAYDLVALETSSGIHERLGTFSTYEQAVAYGEGLIESGEEDRWADSRKDGLLISGPYKLIINPEFKQETELTALMGLEDL